jgi:hypothetical protein
MKYQIAKILFVLVLATFEVKSQTYSGEVTFYYGWRGNWGSCGLERSKTDHFYVAALSRFFMGGVSNPNNHPRCAADQCIQIYGARGSVVLKISDTCPSCDNYNVDIADSVYGYLDDPDKGRVRMNWHFTNCFSNPPGRR